MTPYYEKSGQTIYCGDNVSVLTTFPDSCIDLVVTSPPYDNLRTYGGHSWDFESVAFQLVRVIKDGGVIVWVVADATIDGSETGTSMRQALRFKELGLRLHDTMIWEKGDPSPGDGKFRYHDAWEFMFVLSKGRPSRLNLIRDVPADRPPTVYTKTWDRRRDQEPGGSPRKTWTSQEFGFRRNIWKSTHGGHQVDAVAFRHPAIFPEAIARDHILSWSNEGDTVLDPFNGSGTTTKMARECGRLGIGIDVNEEYCSIAARRLEQGILNFEAS